MSELGAGTSHRGVPIGDPASPGPSGGALLRAGRRLPPAARVGLFSVALAGVALVLYLVFLRDHPAPEPPGGLRVPWFVLSGAFFVAEMRVIDVHFRREKHSFSLSEFPAVIGFFLLSPTEYFAAMLLGASAALLWTRHSPVKYAFNLSNWALCAAAGLTVFYLMQTPQGMPDPWSWLAAFAATGTAAVISATSIATAITVSGGAPQFEKLPEMYQFGLLVAVANTSLALLAVALLWSHPVQLALLIVPLVTVFLAYRAYQSEREKHQRLDLLYQSSRILQHSPELDQAVGALLEHAREMFRAERAEILLWPREAERDGLLTTATHDAPVSTMVSVPLDAAHPLHRRVALDQRPFLHLAPTRDNDGVRHAMVAPLAGESGLIGSLVVANRLTEGTTSFDDDDLRLLETLANQAAVALQNGQLEQSLGELSRLKEELRFQAYHDPLTGLANRSLFADRVDAALREADDDRVPVVLFLDLDDFKDVNDTLGHATGDRLLVAVAERVRSCIREEDLAARLGGDEFALLVHDDDRLGRALAVARRLIDALAVPIPVTGEDLTVSASIGIAAARAVTTADELLRNADVAMYTAKQSGKNGFSVFDPQMHSAIVARHALSGELARGIAEGEIVVWYQPIVNLATGGVYGAEALARWQHPTRGIVEPDEFIRLAEESGAILALGRAVLFDACREAAAWSPSASGPIVTVNLSAAQLVRDAFVAEVVDVLRATGLAPTRLVLEMIETAMFHDVEATIARLSQLKELGVRVAIDDFGTGYSSLGYLRRFPVDILKIAREFIVQGSDAHDGWPFASAIIGLGRSLNLRVVAEGIETDAQRDELIRLGCELGQGYLYARPVPAIDARRLLVPAAPSLDRLRTPSLVPQEART